MSSGASWASSAASRPIFSSRALTSATDADVATREEKGEDREKTGFSDFGISGEP
jgi:hypothetical protein